VRTKNRTNFHCSKCTILKKYLIAFYSIRIDITEPSDAIASETSWDIQKVDTVGGNEVLISSKGTLDEDRTARKESICLVDGMVSISIHDCIGVG
jgi:hypothetical protein